MSCSSDIVSPILSHSKKLELVAATDDSFTVGPLASALVLTHLNKVGQEVREAVRAEGYTDGFGQGGSCGGEGHDLSCWVEEWSAGSGFVR